MVNCFPREPSGTQAWVLEAVTGGHQELHGRQKESAPCPMIRRTRSPEAMDTPSRVRCPTSLLSEMDRQLSPGDHISRPGLRPLLFAGWSPPLMCWQEQGNMRSCISPGSNLAPGWRKDYGERGQLWMWTLVQEGAAVDPTWLC